MTRCVIISDLHSMHRAGLTHPDFDAKPKTDPRNPHYRLWRLRLKMYEWYKQTLEDLQPIDLLIVNGDAVEGKGAKSGGTEVLTTDRSEQASCAAVLINMAKARLVEMTYGTPYHTGVDEDWEAEASKEIENLGKIESVGYYQVDKLVIQARHFASRSSVPYGRFTPIARQHIWNVLWKERGEYPKVDIIVRSHVHYFTHCGEADWMAFTTPALQAYWTKYGTRICSGTVDFGLMWIDVEGSSANWDVKLLKLRRPGEAITEVNKLLGNA